MSGSAVLSKEQYVLLKKIIKAPLTLPFNYKNDDLDRLLKNSCVTMSYVDDNQGQKVQRVTSTAFGRASAQEYYEKNLHWIVPTIASFVSLGVSIITLILGVIAPLLK